MPLIADVVLGERLGHRERPCTSSAAWFASIRSPDGASTMEIASGDCSTTVIRRLCSPRTCSISCSRSRRARRSAVMSRKKMASPSARAIHPDVEPVVRRDLELERLDCVSLPSPRAASSASSGAIHVPHRSQRLRPTIDGPAPRVRSIPSRLSCPNDPVAIERDEGVAHRVEHVHDALARTLCRRVAARGLRDRAKIVVRLLELDGLCLELRRLLAKLRFTPSSSASAICRRWSAISRAASARLSIVLTKSESSPARRIAAKIESGGEDPELRLVCFALLPDRTRSAFSMSPISSRASRISACPRFERTMTAAAFSCPASRKRDSQSRAPRAFRQ